MMFYNLNTMAKSGLLFYEDFLVTGRYKYTNQLDQNKDLIDIVHDLYWEFDNCLRGRDYYNSDWKDIGVKLGLIHKKVTYNTIVEYV